jgi:hypothetical protein
MAGFGVSVMSDRSKVPTYRGVLRNGKLALRQGLASYIPQYGISSPAMRNFAATQHDHFP